MFKSSFIWNSWCNFDPTVFQTNPQCIGVFQRSNSVVLIISAKKKKDAGARKTEVTPHPAHSPWQNSGRRPSRAEDPPRLRFPGHFRRPHPRCHHSPSRSRRSVAAAGAAVGPGDAGGDAAGGRGGGAMRGGRVREVGTVSTGCPGRAAAALCATGRVPAGEFRPGRRRRKLC